jgi:hypothetical protein
MQSLWVHSSGADMAHSNADINSGHYRALVLHNDLWFLCDDDIVLAVDFDSFVRTNSRNICGGVYSTRTTSATSTGPPPPIPQSPARLSSTTHKRRYSEGQAEDDYGGTLRTSKKRTLQLEIETNRKLPLTTAEDTIKQLQDEDISIQRPWTNVIENCGHCSELFEVMQEAF